MGGVRECVTELTCMNWNAKFVHTLSGIKLKLSDDRGEIERMGELKYLLRVLIVRLTGVI